MAGKGNSAGNKFVFLQLRFDKLEKKTYFSELAKLEGKWTPIENYSYIEGKLVDIEVKSQKSQKGEEYKKIVFSFDFGEDEPIHKVDSSFSMLGRSLINTLSACEAEIKAGKELNISVYENKSGYSSLCVREPGTSGKDGMYGWRWSMDQLPKSTKHVINGKDVYDHTAINEMMEKIIAEKIKPNCPGIPDRDGPAAKPAPALDALPEDRSFSGTPGKQETGMDLPNHESMPPDDLPF